MSTKYYGYKVVGSLDYKDVIEEDQVWELIMISNNTEKYNVFFYSDDSQDVISHQVVTSIDDIVYPDEDLSYTKYGLYKYVFTGWQTVTNLNSITNVYPKFTRTIIDESTCQYELIVACEANYIYLDCEKTGTTYGQAYEYYILGGNYLTKTKLTSLGELDNVMANTTYIYTLKYQYTLSTLEEVWIEKEITFTTPSEILYDDSENNIKNYYISFNNIYFESLIEDVGFVRLSNSNEDYMKD